MPVKRHTWRLFLERRRVGGHPYVKFWLTLHRSCRRLVLVRPESGVEHPAHAIADCIPCSVAALRPQAGSSLSSNWPRQGQYYVLCPVPETVTDRALKCQFCMIERGQ